MRSIGGYLSVRYAGLETEIRPTLLPPFSDDSDRLDFEDIGLVPLSLYWNVGPVGFNVYSFDQEVDFSRITRQT